MHKDMFLTKECLSAKVFLQKVKKWKLDNSCTSLECSIYLPLEKVSFEYENPVKFDWSIDIIRRLSEGVSTAS